MFVVEGVGRVFTGCDVGYGGVPGPVVVLLLFQEVQPLDGDPAVLESFVPAVGGPDEALPGGGVDLLLFIVHASDVVHGVAGLEQECAWRGIVAVLGGLLEHEGHEG